MGAHIPEQGKQVVQPQPRCQLPPGDTGSHVHGKEEGTGPHHVGCNSKEDPSFSARLEDESPMTMLEVAQAAVHQSRAARARAGAEVTFVDQDGSDAAHRGIPRDARAGHAAADHQEVELLGDHCLQVVRADSVGERSVH